MNVMLVQANNEFGDAAFSLHLVAPISLDYNYVSAWNVQSMMRLQLGFDGQNNIATTFINDFGNLPSPDHTLPVPSLNHLRQ